MLLIVVLELARVCGSEYRRFFALLVFLVLLESPCSNICVVDGVARACQSVRILILVLLVLLVCLVLLESPCLNIGVVDRGARACQSVRI